MEKTLIDGAQISDVQIIGDVTYNLYTRIDGYFAILRVNDEETEFRWHIGFDKVSTNGGLTPNLDALWAAPDATGIEYERPVNMSKAQKRLFLQALRGYDTLTERDFQGA